MGTQILTPDVGPTIKQSDVEGVRAALRGTLVPRNQLGEPADCEGDLGMFGLAWGSGHFCELFVNGFPVIAATGRGSASRELISGVTEGRNIGDMEETSGFLFPQNAKPQLYASDTEPFSFVASSGIKHTITRPVTFEGIPPRSAFAPDARRLGITRTRLQQANPQNPLDFVEHAPNSLGFAGSMIEFIPNHGGGIQVATSPEISNYSGNEGIQAIRWNLNMQPQNIWVAYVEQNGAISQRLASSPILSPFPDAIPNFPTISGKNYEPLDLHFLFLHIPQGDSSLALGKSSSKVDGGYYQPENSDAWFDPYEGRLKLKIGGSFESEENSVTQFVGFALVDSSGCIGTIPVRKLGILKIFRDWNFLTGGYSLKSVIAGVFSGTGIALTPLPESPFPGTSYYSYLNVLGNRGHFWSNEPPETTIAGSAAVQAHPYLPAVYHSTRYFSFNSEWTPAQ